MKTRKLIAMAVLTFCFAFSLFSESINSAQAVSLEDLLSSYLENDLTLKNLIIQKQKAELSKESTEISNGFDISLSTGTMSVRTVNGATSFSMRPSAEASLPQYKNLSLKAGSNISVSDGTEISDTSLSVGVDIISEKELNRKITLMKAERSVLEADWKLLNQALNTEKSFYNELKSLFTKAQNILSDKSSLYSDTISFEETRARGFAETSSTYKLSQMKVMNTQHSVETKMREFNHDLTMFYAKCGITSDNPLITESQNTDDALENFLEIFSPQIPVVEPVKIANFEKENYIELESAKWNYQINSLSRSEKKNFTLGASAGYTFDNSSVSGGGNAGAGGSKTRIDTADIGVTSTIGGVRLTGGVNIPVTGDSHSPTFTASATITPNTFKQNKITQQNNDLSEQQELIAIKEAENKYETMLIDETQSLNDLQWQKSTNENSLQMYKEVEADMKAYYNKGIIKESEYLSAKTNVDLYTIKTTINDIDLIIYNNEIKSLFR